MFPALLACEGTEDRILEPGTRRVEAGHGIPVVTIHRFVEASNGFFVPVGHRNLSSIG